MPATDELREGLRKRGESWHKWPDEDSTTWQAYSNPHTATESMDGTLIVTGLTPAQAVTATLGPVITGDTSDGYHTFNELYHHRAVLFSVIVRDHADLAWKSKAHHDGTMYDGMFIVGIETPQGQATYHYDIDPYWDMFECKELDREPEWDGHTPDEAIARIATLGAGTCQVDTTENWLPAERYHRCKNCGAFFAVLDASSDIPPRFCPNCGRRIEVDE